MRPIKPFMEITDGRRLARSLIDTIRDPTVILSDSFHVIAASRSFLSSFGINEREAIGHLFSEFGGDQWRLSELHDLLKQVATQSTLIDGFEVQLDLPKLGVRKFLLTARQLHFDEGITSAILLALEDVTTLRAMEKEKQDQTAKTEMLLNEMQHRIANSLMIIASILLLKARSVASDETRSHLLDAHQRVKAIAEIQRYLQPTFIDNRIEIAPYLSKLCQSLASSMVGADRPHTVIVDASEGLVTSGEAVSLGLITTELIINALKHAFLDGRTGHIAVTFGPSGQGWQLSVADNGVGMPANETMGSVVGLGTTIVESLARQLRGNVRSISNTDGTCVSVTTGSLGESSICGQIR